MQQVVQLGLVDEYWLKVMPVAVGQGLGVFTCLDAPADLTLAWHRIYRSGVAGLRYEAENTPDAVVRNRWVNSVG